MKREIICKNKFPIYENIGIQDFLLIFEIWIILKRSFRYRLKRYSELNAITMHPQASPNENWPFNETIFTLYYFSYLYVFYFTSNSRKLKKFKFSFNNLLKDKEICQFKFQRELIELFYFPEKFKLKCTGDKLIDFGKLNYF